MYSILILVVLFGAMYFFMIRPQQRRAAEQRAQRSSVTPGDEVMLTSGIFATVVEKTDDHVLVEIAEGVQVRVVAAAIGNILPKDEPEETTADLTQNELGSATLAPESTIDLPREDR